MIILKNKQILKTFRQSLGISQEEISKIIDVSQSSISKIENGKLLGSDFVTYLEF